jgi:hypothetical protein
MEELPFHFNSSGLVEIKERYERVVVVEFLAEHKPFFLKILFFNVMYLQREVFPLKNYKTNAGCYL